MSCYVALLSVLALLFAYTPADGAEAVPPDADQTLPTEADLKVVTDDTDPVVITDEELLQIGAPEVNGALPLLDREPFRRAGQWLDQIELMLKESFNLQFTPELTTIWQAAPIGGSDNDTLVFNLDVPIVWTPLESEEWFGRGTLGFLYRYRDEFLGTTPGELSDAIGVNFQVNDTGVGPTNLSTVLELWWEQAMFDEQLIVRLGRVDQGAYLDGNRYAGSDKRLFLAEPLATGAPNRRFPQEGFGFNVVYIPNELPFYVAFGMSDANAINTRSGFDTVDDGDYFFGGSVAFTPVIEGLGKGIYRFTGTYTMPNPTLGEAWSVMLSFDQDVEPCQIGTFFRYGISDGDALTLDQQLSLGVVYLAPFGFTDDRAGIGFLWFGADGAAENDFGVELFYRFKLARRVELTPDIQLLAPHANRDFTAVFGLRLRTIF